LQAQLYTTTAGYTISTYKLPQRVYNKLSDELINLAHDVCVNCYNNVFNCDDYSIAKAIMLSKCHSETLRLFPKATQPQADIVTRRIAHDVFGIQ
jgi:hypothetical protein